MKIVFFQSFFKCILLSTMFLFSFYLQAKTYDRVVDTVESVKPKLFPKKGKIEIVGPDFGGILNQAFIRTYLIHGGITYYPSETYGFGIEGAYGINQDKSERTCLESFYLKSTQSSVTAECESADGNPSAFAKDQYSKYGPAYMSIREINYIFSGNFIWSPIYGKQLLFLSATSYFDFFLTLGGGVIMSTYYPQSEQLLNGNTARCAANEQGEFPSNCGADKNGTNLIGIDGRPDPESQTHPFLNLGIGQKFHFLKRISIKFEFRNMTLFGTDAGGFDNLFALWGGFGLRF